MCRLCANPQDVEDEKKRMREIAIELEKMAQNYRGIAEGSINLHKGIAPLKARGKFLIRSLIEDWL